MAVFKFPEVKQLCHNNYKDLFTALGSNMIEAAIVTRLAPEGTQGCQTHSTKSLHEARVSDSVAYYPLKLTTLPFLFQMRKWLDVISFKDALCSSLLSNRVQTLPTSQIV